jgi:hypothetical protein
MDVAGIGKGAFGDYVRRDVVMSKAVCRTDRSIQL